MSLSPGAIAFLCEQRLRGPAPPETTLADTSKLSNTPARDGKCGHRSSYSAFTCCLEDAAWTRTLATGETVGECTNHSVIGHKERINELVTHITQYSIGDRENPPVSVTSVCDWGISASATVDKTASGKRGRTALRATGWMAGVVSGLEDQSVKSRVEDLWRGVKAFPVPIRQD